MGSYWLTGKVLVTWNLCRSGVNISSYIWLHFFRFDFRYKGRYEFSKASDGTTLEGFVVGKWIFYIFWIVQLLLLLVWRDFFSIKWKNIISCNIIHSCTAKGKPDNWRKMDFLREFTDFEKVLLGTLDSFTYDFHTTEKNSLLHLYARLTSLLCIINSDNHNNG